LNLKQEIGIAGISGGGVAEWFMALDLKSGGPWFLRPTSWDS